MGGVNATQNVWTIVENQQGDSSRKVKKQSKKDLKAAGLWDKDAKQMYYVGGHKFSNFLNRVFLGKKADIDAVTRGVAIDNKIEGVSKNGAEFDAKLLDKLTKAGFTKDGKIDIAALQQIYKDHTGTDSYLNYGHDSSEIKNFAGDLSVNGNDITFSKKEAKQIAKALGGQYEKAISLEKTFRDTAYGTIAGAALGQLSPVVQNNYKNGMIANQNKVGQFFGGAIAGGTIAAAGSIYMQITRNEKPVAISTRDLERVNTLEDYNKYADTSMGKKNAAIMKDIASHFNIDGKFDKVAMDNALRIAGGEDSVMNKDEAMRLRSLLGSGKLDGIDFVEPKCPEVDPDIEPEVTPEDKPDPKPEDKPVVKPEDKPKPENDCDKTVIVQNGESPAMIAKKYGIKEADVKELNKNKLHWFKINCDPENKQQGFLVGEDIKLPEYTDCDTLKEAAKNNKDKAGATGEYEGIMEAKVVAGETPCEGTVAKDWLTGMYKKHNIQQ